MRRGDVREGRGMAVLRFCIGLLLLVIVVFAGYYLLVRVDYSGNLDPNTVMRPYVEVPATPTPEPTATPENTLPFEENQPTPTLPPYATPTPKITLEPEATPTPTPAPTPTSIPSAVMSPFRAMNASDMPEDNKKGILGISKCYVSAIDGYHIMQIEGWAFDDVEFFDAQNNLTYFVVYQTSTKKIMLFLATNEPGVSGIEHSGFGKNLEYSDFQVFMDVSSFPDDVYYVGVVLNYTAGGKKIATTHLYDPKYTFTVLGGEVINPLPVTEL